MANYDLRLSGTYWFGENEMRAIFHELTCLIRECAHGCRDNPLRKLRIELADL